MMKLTFLLAITSAVIVSGQRPSFAGTKPIGYPELFTTEGLADRFGEVEGTTQRLPLEANGDRELVDRLSKLPIDKQPFWLINWQALEAHRQNPQTYPQKPNQFIDPPAATFHSSVTTPTVENSTEGTKRFGSVANGSKSENVQTHSGSLSTNSNASVTSEVKLPVKDDRAYHAKI